MTEKTKIDKTKVKNMIIMWNIISVVVVSFIVILSILFESGKLFFIACTFSMAILIIDWILFSTVLDDSFSRRNNYR